MKRKTTFWQIWVPLLVSLMLVCSITFLFIHSISSERSLLTKWADISLIFLVAPIIVLFLINILLGMIAIDGLTSTHSKSKDFLGKAQVFSGNVKTKILQGCSVLTTIFGGPSNWVHKTRRHTK